jgi:hypothetical protein
MKPKKIAVNNIGQIKNAEVTFGDLTVFVGPQATGKSIFLQLLKLIVDAPAVQDELWHFGIDWAGKFDDFLELYFGEGMAGIWQKESRLKVDGKEVDLQTDARSLKRNRDEKLFFIPAQRVMSLRDGQTQPFSVYRSGDPFVLREFSEKLHQLVQNEFGRKPELFPQEKRLKKAERDLISEHIFGGFGLETSAEKMQKQFVLRKPDSHEKGLPYLVWSAGQREFVPLLLGFYWLMPPSATPKRSSLDWVVIEEMEMGLHPNAISTVLVLILDLLSRGYKVCLSTHSPHVLDVVWALQFIKKNGGDHKDVSNIFNLSTNGTFPLTSAALQKELNVYYFGRDGEVRDISNLDPGSDSTAESGWGGLTEFSSHIGDIVAKVARRAEGL